VVNQNLDAERGAATASALHIRVLKFEARALDRLHVVDDATVQVHDGSRIDVDLEAVEVKHLVHHAGAVFKLHGVGEARAAAADHAHTQASRNRILLRHDFLHLRGGVRGQGNGRSFLDFGSSSRRCCGGGLDLSLKQFQ